MKLKNILFVVNDIEKSKTFYKELFDFLVIADFGENVILTEGLVLQEQKVWEDFLEKKVVFQGYDAELYFEENNMDAFLEKLKHTSLEINYLNPLIEKDWGQRIVRLYDPDYHVIEIGETQKGVVYRLQKEGLSVEEIAEKMRLPEDIVKEMAV